ncbi:MAG: hypothetical protein ACRCZY_00800 [Phocaeicola sp.]
MSIFRIIAKGSFGIFAICVGVGSYIYITKGVGGDSFIGICSFGITSILCFILYQAAIWLGKEWLVISTYHCPAKVENSTQVELNIQPSFTESLSITNSEVTHISATETEEVSLIELEEEKAAKEEILKELRIYTESIFEPFMKEADIQTIIQILDDFADAKINGTTFNRSLSSLKGLTVKDFMHYGWNIWARLKPMSRRSTAHFLKKTFPEIMKDTKASSIYAKMTCDEGAFRIKIVKIEDSLL